MRPLAWTYVSGVMLSALALSIGAFIVRPAESPPFWLLACLTLVAALQRIFRIVAPGNKVYESSTIALFAGALLLPPWQFVVMTAIAHALEWAKERLAHSDNLRAWYIQPFNVAKCILAGMAAHGAVSALQALGGADDPVWRFATASLTLLVYVAANQLLLGLALALARGVSFREAGIWRDALLMELPLAGIGYLAALLLTETSFAVLFLLAPIALIYQALMLPKTQDEAFKALQRINRDLADANRAVRQLNDELFLTTAKVFDARDPYVGGHAAQVAVYAIAIAEELGMSPEQIEVVRQSAYLHDIGKIAIPEAILHKPTRLTELEYDFVKRHTDIGADLIASSKGLGHLAPFIRHHHERWDGQGYPTGIAGNAIPVESRILNLCDSVEAMASDRPYHRAMSAQQILVEAQHCAGTQFDPAIVRAFLRVLERRGNAFIVNSARSIASQYSSGLLHSGDLPRHSFAAIYGLVVQEAERFNVEARPASKNGERPSSLAA
jgi:putative nucleotidyltransferase with HDIG domain